MSVYVASSGRGGAGVSHATKGGFADNAQGEDARAGPAEPSVPIPFEGRERAAGVDRAIE